MGRKLLLDCKNRCKNDGPAMIRNKWKYKSNSRNKWR